MLKVSHTVTVKEKFMGLTAVPGAPTPRACRLGEPEASEITIEKYHEQFQGAPGRLQVPATGSAT